MDATAASQIPPGTHTEDVLSDDWSFSHLTRSETLWGPHGYHRYPAKFIPQLVRRIIEQYSDAADLVGDPFLGSATTGVEALRAGRRFYGAEINPVALLISSAKCTPLDPDTLDAAWKDLDERLDAVARLGRHTLTAEQKAAITATDIARASDEARFDYWFPTTAAPLQEILCLIIDLACEEQRTFFLCAFSNILRGCSIWLSGSTKAQKDVGKSIRDPVDLFRSQARDMVKRNRLYWNDLASAGMEPAAAIERCTLRLADAREVPSNVQALDLLVTSPPYATCYEYLGIHQLTQLWLQRHGILNPRDLRSACIGGSRLSDRERASGDDLPASGSATADAALARLWEQSTADARQEARSLLHYFQDMQSALSAFAQSVRNHGSMVLIIGDSRKKGVDIPTAAALCELAEGTGFALQKRIVRKIPVRVLCTTRNSATGRFASSAASDTQVYPEEDILIFKRRPRTAAQ